MRNRNPTDGSFDIPVHFKSEFDDINAQLHLASEQQDRALQQHHEAVLARIAIATEATDAELQTAKEQANAAVNHYVEIIEARIKIVDKINAFVREQESHAHQPWAS